ncbi:hypothetical protein HYH03_001721 [Edaphochlamys debaryana]|uniref:MIB/HERC2 domain-containing protein n=1 Tax=Edaphochlamys debaryana TaxID=47281 RepID=A0A836C5R7_9CHLO|nr:hypothetical protein HYH03_001721 [Edaphochlamys debaryana]|eukprot:KAG2500139.1 hypothetical protein HYH03_001721 [Edaphochlamys debaryana]
MQACRRPGQPRGERRTAAFRGGAAPPGPGAAFAPPRSSRSLGPAEARWGSARAAAGAPEGGCGPAEPPSQPQQPGREEALRESASAAASPSSGATASSAVSAAATGKPNETPPPPSRPPSPPPPAPASREALVRVLREALEPALREQTAATAAAVEAALGPLVQELRAAVAEMSYRGSDAAPSGGGAAAAQPAAAEAAAVSEAAVAVEAPGADPQLQPRPAWPTAEVVAAAVRTLWEAGGELREDPYESGDPYDTLDDGGLYGRARRADAVMLPDVVRHRYGTPTYGEGAGGRLAGSDGGPGSGELHGPGGGGPHGPGGGAPLGLLQAEVLRLQLGAAERARGRLREEAEALRGQLAAAAAANAALRERAERVEAAAAASPVVGETKRGGTAPGRPVTAVMVRRDMRVVRGPDWNRGREDGGAGQLGRIVEAGLDQGEIRVGVKWTASGAKKDPGYYRVGGAGSGKCDLALAPEQDGGRARTPARRSRTPARGLPPPPPAAGLEPLQQGGGGGSLAAAPAAAVPSHETVQQCDGTVADAVVVDAEEEVSGAVAQREA